MAAGKKARVVLAQPAAGAPPPRPPPLFSRAPGPVRGAGEAAAFAAARVIGEGSALRRAWEEAAAVGKLWRPFGEIHLKVRTEHYVGLGLLSGVTWGCGGL